MYPAIQSELNGVQPKCRCLETTANVSLQTGNSTDRQNRQASSLYSWSEESFLLKRLWRRPYSVESSVANSVEFGLERPCSERMPDSCLCSDRQTQAMSVSLTMKLAASAYCKSYCKFHCTAIAASSLTANKLSSLSESARRSSNTTSTR